MLLADLVDDSFAGSLIVISAVVSIAIVVPDRVAQRDIEPIDRPTVGIDEIADGLLVGQSPQYRCIIH
jgi:hypothetical protein